jgi:DNA-binding MarR family transcriptional regulator
VLVIAVQNAVEYADLGVATSGAILFRLIGGSLGTAALGAVFAARLRTNLAAAIPGGAAEASGVATGSMNPQALAALPPALRAAYGAAFTASLSTVFFVATVVALLGFLLIWLLPERPLRESIAAEASDAGHDAGAAFPLPTDGDSEARLLGGLAVLADRDVQRRYIAGIVARAGVEMTPAAAWLLVHLERDPSTDIVALGRSRDVGPERMQAALAELEAAQLVATVPGAPTRRELTPAGCQLFDRLVTARRARLAELFADWAPERHEELAALLRRVSRELVPSARVK